MKITYNNKSDLLYIRLDETAQDLTNRRVDDAIVLDLGDGDRIVGIEIVDASRRLRLDRILPIEYQHIA